MTVVKIEQVNRYTLTVNGVEYPDFRLDSEWEGMAKYCGPRGVVIVSKRDHFGEFFRQIVGETEPVACDLVKASPELAAEIKANGQTEDQRQEAPPL